MSMSKSQIQAALSESTGVSKKDVAAVLDKLGELACREAAAGFTVPGIGKLVLVDRAARTGRNPSTGETIEIPAKKVVKFRVAKSCKDAILGA